MRSFGETPGKREALLNKLVKLQETPVKREETPEKGEEPCSCRCKSISHVFSAPMGTDGSTCSDRCWRVAPTHDDRMGGSIRNSAVIFIAIPTVMFRTVYTAVAFKHLN